MNVRSNARGQYVPQSQYPEYYWHNHKLRRMRHCDRNCYSRDSEHFYIDSCKVKEHSQKFATDREMGCRLLDDTLLEKRVQLDICAEVDYLDSSGEDCVNQYPPDILSMEKYMNDYIGDRIDYELSHDDYPCSDRMNNFRRYRRY